MMYWGNHMGTGGWVFSIFATLIVLALIVAAIAWLFSARRDRGSSLSPPGDSANEILNRRLASGELTAEQYEQLLEKLSDTTPSTFGPRTGRPAGTRV